MSVISQTEGYTDTCERSHEFWRRGCSFSPMSASWAGDILVTGNFLMKQSEVHDMRGAASDVVQPFPEVEGTGCGGGEAQMPGEEYSVEETDIRSGSAKTFEFAIPKAANPEDETNWTLGIYQSTNDCGVLMDGGDALQYLDMSGRALSLCGSIDRYSTSAPVQAHYLDNRKSYPSDPDNGLLVAIRTGFVWSWEVRYAPVGRDLTNGLVQSDDVSEAFTAALSALGMTHSDVFEFGMI